MLFCEAFNSVSVMATAHFIVKPTCCEQDIVVTSLQCMRLHAFVCSLVCLSLSVCYMSRFVQTRTSIFTYRF